MNGPSLPPRISSFSYSPSISFRITFSNKQFLVQGTIPTNANKICSFSSAKMRHAKFLARTVLVQNNNVEEACRVLNRILGKEEIFDQFRRTRYYEKPFQVQYKVFFDNFGNILLYCLSVLQVRRRINFEKCKSIYNEDMNRKIQLVLRKNRVDPFPGCS